MSQLMQLADPLKSAMSYSVTTQRDSETSRTHSSWKQGRMHIPGPHVNSQVEPLGGPSLQVRVGFCEVGQVSSYGDMSCG